MRHKLFIILALFFSGTFVANAQDDSDTPTPISGEIILDILYSLPSPLEISLLIKETGNEYNKSGLTDSEYVTNYTNSFKQALNFGVYSTDLAYANLYGKDEDAIRYLDAMQKLGDSLNISNSIDYAQIKQVALNENNLDSLLQLAQQNAEILTTRLQDERRENLSILMLAGAWTEGLYLATKSYENTPNDQLQEKIGTQKVALQQIILVLDIYKTKPAFAPFVSDLQQLEEAYRPVSLTVTKGEPIMVERDGELLIEQGTTTEVEMTEEDMTEITRLVKLIRGRIIK